MSTLAHDRRPYWEVMCAASDAAYEARQTARFAEIERLDRVIAGCRAVLDAASPEAKAALGLASALQGGAR